MNESTASNRLMRIAPLVLRLGIAAILIRGGWEQVAPSFSGETGETLSTDTEGVDVSANWNTLMGVASCGVGGLLAVGFLTRIVSLAVVGGVGYGAYEACTSVSVDGETLNTAAQTFEASSGALLLLAAACASLLISGAGCLALDTRHRHRRAQSGANPADV